MSELLSTANREYAKNFFQRHMREDILKYGERQAIHIALSALTIDPEELRPKGRWTDKGSYVPFGSLAACVCSNCDREITIDEFDDYCPNCGAKMEV